jgi:hypothetical protein
MEITRTHADDWKRHFEAKDSTGREYRAFFNVKTGEWLVRVYTKPKNRGWGFWRDVRNGRVLAAIQHYDRTH